MLVHGNKYLCKKHGLRDLPDMYTRSPRAAGLRAEGMHIRQINNVHATSNMYHFRSMDKLIVPPFKIENHNQNIICFYNTLNGFFLYSQLVNLDLQ